MAERSEAKSFTHESLTRLESASSAMGSSIPVSCKRVKRKSMRINPGSLKRSGSEDTLKELNQASQVNQTEESGYRSDGSQDQGEDDLDVFIPIPSKDKDPQKSVSKIKRTISGKFARTTKSFLINPGENVSPGLDYNRKSSILHKSIRQGISPKQLGKSLKRGTDVNVIDPNGQSALHLCAALGEIECAKVLLRKGSNVNLQDFNGYTPLHCGALEKQLESCQLLLEAKGVDVTITTNEKANVLHYIVRIPVDEDNVILYRRVLDLLIERGLDLNMGNMHNEAPIHFACMRGNAHNVAFLLERGADCNLSTKLVISIIFLV